MYYKTLYGQCFINRKGTIIKKCHCKYFYNTLNIKALSVTDSMGQNVVTIEAKFCL